MKTNYIQPQIRTYVVSHSKVLLTSPTSIKSNDDNSIIDALYFDEEGEKKVNNSSSIW